MPGEEKERINEQARKHDTLEEQMQKTRDEIMKTYRERRGHEKEFLDVIKNQKRYWEDQLRNTDPEKDNERYEELKGKIENEKSLIKQIKDEIHDLNEELKNEKEHKEKEHKY
ncbi:hypothetical protein [Methanobacterium sp. MBAC-LM]|uniref:hypothetical protein n=1 Tax=Methanobacterium sp. MBAC-LM TaxID=3412034 RepID=UPI003C75171B